MILLNRRDFLRFLTVGTALTPILSASDIIGSVVKIANKTDAFFVNGKSHFIPSIQASLLDILRYDLGLTGVKCGCAKGVCGACTVLIQGRAIRSCEVDARHLAGLNVQTIEGLGGPGSLDPVQKTFADLSVFQCGYCAPGMVLCTRALLNQHSNPSMGQIKEALYGNLCRCTGYQPIVSAVRAVNNPDYKTYLMKRPYSGITAPLPDIIAEEKVTGKLRYAGDRLLPGTLFAKALFSKHPRARILNIDTKHARRMDGIVAVLTHEDVPGKNRFGSIMQDQPVLAKDDVRCMGDVVALAIGRTPEAAGQGIKQLQVTYKPLPGIFDPGDALALGAQDLTGKGNLCWASAIQKGEIKTGRFRADVTVTGRYTTPFIEHAYLETETCTSYIDEDGVIVVITASQAPHDFKEQIAHILDLPTKHVQIKTTIAGGAFGAKADLTIQHLAALGTLVTSRPVRMELTREESIRVHSKRHPFFLEYETGADAKGRLTHCRVKGIADAGAYHSATLPVVENAVSFATGPYEIDHISVDIRAAFTNNPVCGAMRGFGVPQVCLAMERQIDKLAAKLKIDPLKMRIKNCLVPGKVSQWGQVMDKGTGIKSCLHALQKAIKDTRADISPGPDESVGIGIGAMYKNTGVPTYLPFGKTDVTFILEHSGMVAIHVGGSELGQGLVTAFTQISMAGLGIPAQRIHIIFGSTRHTIIPSISTASQQTFLGGGAIHEGAPAFRKHLLFVASKILMNGSKKMPLPADLDLGEKGVVDKANSLLISYENLALRARLKGLELSMRHEYVPSVNNIEVPKKVTKIGPDQIILPSLGYAAHAALVLVNNRTGKVKVKKIFAAQDVGRVISPHGVEGQIVGGTIMGLGWCFKEKLEVRDGRILTDNLDTYHIPRTTDIPVVEPLVVQVPDPNGPMGAKGIGELPLVPVAPAVLNAIFDACGASLDSLPITPQMVVNAIDKGQSETDL